MNLTLKTIFFGILFISIKAGAQEFFVNSWIGSNNNINKVYRLNVSNSNQIDEPFCTPTGPFTELYTDIAIDAVNNLYYVASTGSLYRKNSSDSSCEFLGDFTATFGSITALVADSGAFLYATGSPNKLYKYDINTGIFTLMGSLPTGQYVAGDLFFYDRRLFVTTLTGILEINMSDPSLSCPFINWGTSNIYSAFSVNSGSNSKAYVISSTSSSSTLYELDMVNKQLGPPIRSYNHQINGAACAYQITDTKSTCSLIPLAVQETSISTVFFDVVNPAKSSIICKTNIDRQQIISIQLYDNSGKLVKDFSNQNSIDKLDVSNLSDGVYLLTVATKKGEKYTKKIIIRS